MDGSITKTSPTTFSNLASGKHHVQIVLPEYISEEMDFDVKGGEIASSGVIGLHPVPPVITRPASEGAERKTAATKKPSRKREAAVAQPTKSAPPAARQVAAAPASGPPKIAPKPAASKPISTPSSKPTPEQEQRRRHEFDGSAPGG
jgi:hypothetical protein